MNKFDVVIGGGGIAGSSMGLSLAQIGYSVLIVEQTGEFADRVRGEGVMPWGVAEMAKLGTDKLLLNSGVAREVFKVRTMFSGFITESRELDKEEIPRRGTLCYEHRKMQKVLLDAAESAGVTVWRNSAVNGLESCIDDSNLFDGDHVRVRVKQENGEEVIETSLLIGADGRGSKIAKMAGMERHTSSRPGMLTTGLLVKNFCGPSDSLQFCHDMNGGVASITFPLDAHGKARIYLCRHPNHSKRMFRSDQDIKEFVNESVIGGMSGTSYGQMEPCGPLRTFSGTHTWVDNPYRKNVVLIGDAGSTVDPAFGNGQSLTTRDVRELRDAILSHGSLHEACTSYAIRSSAYYQKLRTVEEWMVDVLYAVGEEAQALRARILPLLQLDGSRLPDIIALGPEAPSDEVAKMRLFGVV